MNVIFRCLSFHAIQMPLTSDTLPQIQQCFHASNNIRLYTPYNSGANSLTEYSKNISIISWPDIPPTLSWNQWNEWRCCGKNTGMPYVNLAIS